MKKLNLICLALISIGLQSCSSDVKNDDDTVALRDTAKLTVPIDKDDAQFAIQAENSSLTEIELSKLAIKKGHDKRIRNSGAMMIKDHAKTGNRLQLIAKTKKITLPVTIDSIERKNITNLQKLSGTAFDHAYLDVMIREHEANIKLFQTASKQLMDPDLRLYAAKNLLVFKRHLELINEVKGSMR